MLPSKRNFLLGVSSSLLTSTGFSEELDLAHPASRDAHFWTDPRVVRVHNLNTGQRGQFVYWRDGAYDMAQYRDLSVLFLDHRENKAVQMHPSVFDAVFATQRWYERATGRPALTYLTSGHRTPRTNRLVHGSPGSEHLLAGAGDGWMAGISLDTYAAMLIKLRLGGVGLYSKHVHWDAGRVRFWRGGYRE